MTMQTTIEKRADDALARATEVLKEARKVAPPLHDKAIHLTKDAIVFGVKQGAVVAMPDGEPEGTEVARGSDDFSFVMRDGADEVLRIWHADHFAKSSALREALGVRLDKGETVTVGRHCGTSDDVAVYREVAVCTTAHPAEVQKEATDFDLMYPMQSLAGEAGVHMHLLNRTAGRTANDGGHGHLFVIERDVKDPGTGEVVLSGMILVTDRDGAHEHPFEGGDETGPEEEGHVHRVTLDPGMRSALASLLGTENLTDAIGVEIATESDGQHTHEVQVNATGADGVHRHVLTLPDGSTVTSMNGDDFSAMFSQMAVAMSARPKMLKDASDAAAAVGTKTEAPDVSDAPPTEGAADVDKAGHVHSLPEGGMTGTGEGDEHTHSLPDGGMTGPPIADDAGHVHALPSGDQTGAPREEVASVDAPAKADPEAVPAADDPPSVEPESDPVVAEVDPARVAEALKRSVRLLKAADPEGDEERFVFGVVLVPGETDSQGDTYDADEVRKAAHGYMQHFGGTLKLMHQGQPVAAARVVETYLTKAPETHGEETFPVGTWLMGTKVDRSDPGDVLWGKVLGGDFTGYSIGGTALREALAPSDG